MEGSRSRISRRWHGRIAGLTALTLTAGTSLLYSAAIASPSWAAGSNGEAGKPAMTILADAKKATDKARTAHVVGKFNEGGTTTTIDIRIGHGQGGGSVSQGGVSFDIILHKPKVYLKAGKATWTKLSNSAAAQILANRWLQTTTANKDFSDLAKLMDLGTLTNQLTPSGSLIKKGTTTYRGQKAIPLFDSGPGGGTLYVAAQGTPYILGLAPKRASQGSVRFSGYNTTKIPPAPKNSINLNALEASGGGGGSSGGSATTVPAGGIATTIPTGTA